MLKEKCVFFYLPCCPATGNLGSHSEPLWICKYVHVEVKGEMKGFAWNTTIVL